VQIELRKVPENWVHPSDNDGNYIPLMEGDYESEKAEWDRQKTLWEEGFYLFSDGAKRPKQEHMTYPFEEWRSAPDKKYHMFDEKPENLTHFCLYEYVSPGTPLTHACVNLVAVARFIVGSKVQEKLQHHMSFGKWLEYLDRLKEQMEERMERVPF